MCGHIGLGICVITLAWTLLSFSAAGEAMKNNDCVTELELSSGGITSAALKQLCVSLHGNITLTTLDISNNHFMDSDIHG